MVRRKLTAEFPFFFTYTVFQVLSVAVLFAIFHFAPSMYFYAYWTSSALGIMLAFAIIHEVFCYAIRPYVGLRDLGNLLFRWATFLLVLIGGMLAISAAGMNSKQLFLAIIDVERAVRLMQCGLLLFVFVCSSYLGLTWRNFASGIALGYGIFATTDLVMFSLHGQLGPSWNSTLGIITTSAYNLSVLTWFGYALMPESARQRVHAEVVYRPVFDRWNQAAMALVTPSPALVPGMSGQTYLTEIERTVENIMAQKSGPASNGYSEKEKNQKIG
ncbi:MAG: hypothetical protein JWO20_1027 [Candidatus Angelobacter sp.]|nr:hypothetical protein [Candidatus Angelobacter sp.]